MYIFVIYDTNMRSNSKVWILDYGVFALWGYNNSDDHWDCLYKEIDLQDYFKSFLYPLIATIAMILISEVTKWYLKGIIGDFIGILVCVLVYLAVVYVVARKQLLNIIQTIKKEKV